MVELYAITVTILQEVDFDEAKKAVDIDLGLIKEARNEPMSEHVEVNGELKEESPEEE